MRPKKNRVLLFCHHLQYQLFSLALRLGCIFISYWFYIDTDFICTTGKVLQLNGIYTFKHGDNVDIVQLTDVHIEREYNLLQLIYLFQERNYNCPTYTVNRYAHYLESFWYGVWWINAHKQMRIPVKPNIILSGYYHGGFSNL